MRKVIDMFCEIRQSIENGDIDAEERHKKFWKRAIISEAAANYREKYVGGWALLFTPYNNNNEIFDFNKELKYFDLDAELPPSLNGQFFQTGQSNVYKLKSFYNMVDYKDLQSSTIDCNFGKYKAYTGFFKPHYDGNYITFNIGANICEDAMVRERRIEAEKVQKRLEGQQKYLSIGAYYDEKDEIHNIIDNGFSQKKLRKLYVPKSLLDYKNEIKELFYYHTANYIEYF
jgi:hypothetical protein